MGRRTTPEGMLAMFDAGRSWTEIARKAGVSVAEAKAAVAELKRERREALARTELNERHRGFLDECKNPGCSHARKVHDENGCQTCGPDRTIWRGWDESEPDVRVATELTFEQEPAKRQGLHVWGERVGCDSFRDQPPRGYGPGWRPGDATSEARARGWRPWERRRRWGRGPSPELPQQATRKHQLRRLRRKQK